MHTTTPSERPIWLLWLFYSGVDFALGWGLGGAAFAAAWASPQFELRLLGAAVFIFAAALARWIVLNSRCPEQDGLLAAHAFLLLSGAAVAILLITLGVNPGVNPGELAPYGGKLLFQALAGGVFGAATWFALRWALPSPTPRFDFEDENR